MPRLDVFQYALAHALDMAHGTQRMETWSELLPKHLSPTSLTMFERCPEQYRHRYVLGEKERPAESPTIGSAVHRALERNFLQKVGSGVDLPTAELLDFYDDAAWPDTLTSSQEKAGQEIWWDTTPEMAHVRGRVMLGEYRNQVAPRIQPLSVENRVELDFGAPVPIVGYYDIEAATEMVDIKTGKRKMSKPKGDWRLQGAIYVEHAAKPVAFHSVSATEKTNSVSIVTPLEEPRMLINPSAAQRARMRADVRMAAATIAFYMTLLGPDEAWPTSGVHHDWACDYCGFRRVCPAWVDG